MAYEKRAAKTAAKVAKKSKKKETAKKIIKSVAKGMAGSSVSTSEMKKAMGKPAMPKGDAYKKLMSKGSKGTKAATMGAMAPKRKSSITPPGVKVGVVKPKAKKAIAKAMGSGMSSVTDAEYKAAMRKGAARKKKNEKEYRKSN